MRQLTRVPPLLLFFSFGLLIWSTDLFAGTIHSCQESVKKVKDSEKIDIIFECRADLDHGNIGELVEIKNEYNRTVGIGKIVNKRRRNATIMLKEQFKEIKSGYTVNVRNSDSADYLTATMAPY
jgi:hypothetical protein